MIIYGSRTKQTAKSNVAAPCPNCSTNGSIEIRVLQKFAHIFWIPLFPVGKKAMSECSHCKQVLQYNEMRPALMGAFAALKEKTKTPLWTFTGLGLIAVWLGIGWYSSEAAKRHAARLLLNPAKGDVLTVETSGSMYTLYKVSHVNGDSVFVYKNKYQTDTEFGIDRVKDKGPEGYSGVLSIFTRQALQLMQQQGKITEIERP